MSLKDLVSKFNKNKPVNNNLSEEDISNNEFYIEEPKKKSYSRFRYVDRKKIITIGAIAIIVLILLILGIKKFSNMSKEERDDFFNLGNLLNQEAVEKNEEQQTIHSLILRNSAWGSSMDDVAIEERGNLIDYGDDYLTCDYETLFGLTWLPTYLFKDNRLVAILYEANLSQANLDELSSIHQDVAVNIHYVYEQLYRENNKWATGQPRKYDKNLWTKSILNGKLTMQSVWNSSNEKIFLVTNNKPLFGFLQKVRGTSLKAYMAFIIVSDEYLLTNDFNDLMEIKPSNNGYGDIYNAGGTSIELVPADDVNVDTQVGTTTSYTGTVKPDNLTDEEFEAILNELYGNSEEGTRVDSNGNIIDKDGKVIGNIDGSKGTTNGQSTSGGGTTMTSPGSSSNSSISNGNSSNGNSSSGSGNSSNSEWSNNNTGNSNGTNNGVGGTSNGNNSNYDMNNSSTNSNLENSRAVDADEDIEGWSAVGGEGYDPKVTGGDLPAGFGN